MNEEIRNKGWSQMKDLLDKEMPVKRTGLMVFPWIRAAAIVVLLLAAGVVYLGMPYYQNYELTTESAEGKSTSPQEDQLIAYADRDITEGQINEEFSENKKLGTREETSPAGANKQPHVKIPSTVSQNAFSTFHGSTTAQQPTGKELSKDPGELKPVNDAPYTTGFNLPVGNKKSQHPSFLNILPPSDLLPLSRVQPDLIANSLVFPAVEYEVESQAPNDEENLSCPSGLQLGLSWNKPSVHKLHGLGLQVGGKKVWKKSALIVSAGLTKYGWFGSSDSDVLHAFSEWEGQGSIEESEFQFRREYADELISNYLEVDLEVAWRYYVFSKISVGPQIRLARVFDPKFKSNGEIRFDSDPSSEIPLRISSQPLVNPLYLSAGLGLAYDFNCKWGVELTYQRHLSHFWKEEESQRSGRGYTLGLGVKMGLSRSK
nr:autotransporter outer membrane beta-barrel domain-containing protein [Saprospiraceae bacterium]